MTWLLALLSFILSLCFYAWGISHGIWTWQLFMLAGFVLKTLSEYDKAP